jgi:hypothetical protein
LLYIRRVCALVNADVSATVCLFRVRVRRADVSAPQLFRILFATIFPRGFPLFPFFYSLRRARPVVLSVTSASLYIYIEAYLLQC